MFHKLFSAYMIITKEDGNNKTYQLCEPCSKKEAVHNMNVIAARYNNPNNNNLGIKRQFIIK